MNQRAVVQGENKAESARGAKKTRCACGGLIAKGGECATCRAKRLAKENARKRSNRGSGSSTAARGVDLSRIPTLLGERPGATAKSADNRCHAEGTCPEDPLADFQGSGRTWCDIPSGTMRTQVTEHCAGDCVTQHENVHVRDRQECCARVKQCVDRAPDQAGRDACVAQFRAWWPKLSDWTECNAYTREVSCLTDLISAGCGAGGTIPAACCAQLRRELTFATGQQTSRCASAKFVPCPFPSGLGDFPLPDTSPDAPRLA